MVFNGLSAGNEVMDSGGAFVPTINIKVQHLNGFPNFVYKVFIIVAAHLITRRITIQISDTEH